MDIDEPGWTVIDDFFERLAEGRKPETRRRYARVRLRLYDYLDVDDMTEWLGPDDATLLAVEREFLRVGAVWGLFGIDGVLRCLPGFLTEDYLPTSAAEARMQISVVDRFLLRLRTFHAVPAESVGWWVLARRAAREARWDLETRLGTRPPSLQRAVDHIDARFRRRPGPQW